MGGRVAIVAFALVAAAWAGSDQDVRKAIGELRSRDAEARARAAAKLANMGSAAQRAVPHLVKALGDDDDKVRWNVTVALKKIGVDSVPALVKGLKNRDPEVRVAICDVLASKELLGFVPPFAEALTGVLKDRDASVRNAGVALFIKIGALAIDPLIAVLSSSDEDDRDAAVRALVGVSGDVVRKRVCKAFEASRSSNLREAACRVLGGLGAKGAAAGPTLLEALRDSNDDVRGEAARALGRTGASYKGVEILLFNGLGAESPRVREGCIDGLAAYGAVAAPVLVKRLDEKNDPVVRRSAAEALHRMGGPAWEALQDVLDGGSASQRLAAIGLAVRAGSSATQASTLAGVRTCLKSEDAAVREAAAAALGDLGRNRTVDRKVSDDTIDALDAGAADAVAAVRAASLTSLGRLGDRRVVPTVEKAGKDTDPRVRMAALFAAWGLGADPAAALAGLRAGLKEPKSRAAALVGLARMCVAAEEAVPEIVELLEDEQPEVRRLAAHALGVIVRPGRHGVKELHGQWRKKAPAPVRQAIEKGLAWLVHAQSDGGFWDCDEHGGGALYDPGVTGLALWTLLGSGETDTTTVQRGCRYLMAQQQLDGVIGTRATHSFGYNHASGGIALAEAWLLTGNPQYLRALEEAVGFAEVARNPDLAWRYAPRDGENDTHMTAWMLTLLRLADLGGVPVEAAAYDGAGAWIEWATDPKSGQIGYNWPGGLCARPEGKQEIHPPEQSQATTAAGLWCRHLIGGESLDAKSHDASIGLCMALVPYWHRPRLDFDYFHFGSLAVFQGGPWRKWEPALHEAFVPHQAEDGSWPPLGVWGADGGTVYSTSLALLSLLVPYRYPKGFASDPKPSSDERDVIRALKRATKDDDAGVAAAATEALRRVEHSA